MKYFIRAKRIRLPLPTQPDYRIGSIYSDESVARIDRDYEWLECDGRSLERQQYPDLFEIIGTAFGRGDGQTTFNLPTIHLFEQAVKGQIA